MQTAAVLDLSAIPAAQRTAVQALMEEVAALKDITQRQEHLIAELNHALHGKRSEKLSEDERQLAFEDLSIALAEVEAEKEKRAAKAGDGTTRPTPKRTIGNLPAALPRIEEVIDPDSLNCFCGCGVMHKIGEDRTERLDIVPAQLRVIVTVRPKYACRSCTDGVTQAPSPSHLIMGGLPTEASHPPCGRDRLAMAGIDPSLVLALQHGMTGDQLTILEDPNLGRVVLGLDDPPPRGVGNAVLIATHRNHAFLTDAPFDRQNRIVGLGRQGPEVWFLLDKMLIHDPMCCGMHLGLAMVVRQSSNWAFRSSRSWKLRPRKKSCRM